MIINRNSAKISQPVPGITRRIMAHSDQIMLTEHVLVKGAVLPDHNHPHEQLIYLLSGELLLEISGEKLTMKTGDSLVVPSGKNHRATALQDSMALDIFTPARQDYL